MAYVSSLTSYRKALGELIGLLQNPVSATNIRSAYTNLQQHCQEYLNAASVWWAETMLCTFGRRSIELLRMRGWYSDHKDFPVHVALRIEDIDVPLAIILHHDWRDTVGLLLTIGVPVVFTIPIGKSKPERFSTFCVTKKPQGMSAVCCVASTLCCLYANHEVRCTIVFLIHNNIISYHPCCLCRSSKMPTLF